MTSVSTISFLKSRLYSKSRLFKVKFYFGHKISFLKSRLYLNLRFVKLRLYCIGIKDGSLHAFRANPTRDFAVFLAERLINAQ